MNPEDFWAEIKRWLRRLIMTAVYGFAFWFCLTIHGILHQSLMGLFPPSGGLAAVKEVLDGLVFLVFCAIYVVLLFDTLAIFVPPLTRFKDKWKM
jgi:hypothetical protein